MFEPTEDKFAASMAAEVPLVAGYILGLALFALMWTDFSPPANSIVELHAASLSHNQEASR